MGVFNKTIIPLTLVGYEMIIANSALCASLAIYHLISNAPSLNNCSMEHGLDRVIVGMKLNSATDFVDISDNTFV